MSEEKPTLLQQKIPSASFKKRTDGEFLPSYAVGGTGGGGVGVGFGSPGPGTGGFGGTGGTGGSGCGGF